MKANDDSITSSMMAGPAEDLFLAASALSFAVRMMDRCPHVDGERSRIRRRRVGGLVAMVFASANRLS